MGIALNPLKVEPGSQSWCRLNTVALTFQGRISLAVQFSLAFSACTLDISSVNKPKQMGALCHLPCQCPVNQTLLLFVSG